MKRWWVLLWMSLALVAGFWGERYAFSQTMFPPVTDRRFGAEELWRFVAKSVAR